MMRHRLFLAACLILSPVFSWADTITIEDAWARATPPGAKTGAIYLTIANAGDDDELIGAVSPVSWEAQIHTHVHADGMMRMEQIPGLPLPADGEAVLKPGGDHLMLMGLKQGLVPGEKLELTLEFKHHGHLRVEIPIKDGRR